MRVSSLNIAFRRPLGSDVTPTPIIPFSPVASVARKQPIKRATILRRRVEICANGKISLNRRALFADAGADATTNTILQIQSTVKYFPFTLEY